MSAECIPNPGSDEASALGCRCPRVDNARGRGHGLDPDTGQATFIVSDACALHWPDWFFNGEVPA